jgi:SAM-dependent methyltransferase
MPRTDYGDHDRAYKLFREQGQVGWGDAATIADTLAGFERALAHETIPRAGRVLELGCGAGDVSLMLAARGYEATGVDISETAIDWARQKAAERGLAADFRVGSVLDLPGLPDSHFDLVVDGHCLHCIIGEDRARFLAEARRVLRCDGILHVNTMCGEPRGGFARDAFDEGTRCVMRPNGIALRYLGLPESIVDEVLAAGFVVLDWCVDAARDDPEASDDLWLYAAKPE